MALPTCKCVVVGDGTVGKTCMLSVYAKKGFPTKYIPTIFDNYSATVDVEGAPIQLALWDTAGQEEFDKLRLLSYPKSHVFIICFAVDNATTFANVKERWYAELRPYLTAAKVILVGTKADRRADDLLNEFVTKEQAEALRAELGFFKYLECSAKQNQNVKDVFDDAIRARFTLPMDPAPGGVTAPAGGKPRPPGAKAKKPTCLIL